MNNHLTQPSASPDFVPLTRGYGIAANELMLHLGQRNLIVWGAGMLGRCLMRLLSAYAPLGQLAQFADSNTQLIGQYVDGHHVLDPDVAIQQAFQNKTFIVVALGMHNKSVIHRLSAAGLAPDTHFISHLKLSRPEAVIQVAASDGHNHTVMQTSIYASVLHKLKSDIPDLFHVELSGWGDPLVHPDLPNIISLTLPIAPCTVTTQLLHDEAVVERVLQAQPTQLVITPPHGITKPEGYSWGQFVHNVEFIAKTLRKQACQTEVRFRFPKYRDNDAIGTATSALCETHNLRRIEAIGYIDPYDTTLDICRSGNFSVPQVQQLAWPLDKALTWAEHDRTLPCLCQRIFPVIYPDTSVGICHLYFHPRIHPSYLSIDHNDLLALRLTAEHCRTCQRYALHRLDIDVLQQRHKIQLIPPRPSETAL